MTRKKAARALALGLGFLCSFSFAEAETERRLALDPVGDGIALSAGICAALCSELLLPKAPELETAPDASRLPGFDAWACRPFSQGLSTASAAALGVAVLWPASFALIGKRDELLPAAAACAEALAWTYAAKECAKALFPRPRPYAYRSFPIAEDLREEANESFPSGHTALAFSAATCFAVMALQTASDNPATPYLVAGGYAAAAAAAALRLAAGEHFPSDVIAGALLGSAIGWVTAHVHARDTETGAKACSLFASAAGGPSLMLKLRLN